MTLSSELRLFVQERAHYACEYCGVTEVDVGGELTIDHHHPPSRGGSPDHPDNLLYCCSRCNLYKSDYWPRKANDVSLWNPRAERREQHMLNLADGTLYPVSESGTFTIRRLRLNRPPLVAHRLRKHQSAEESRLLTELRQLIALQEGLQQQYAQLLKEQQDLLEQQRDLLSILLKLLQ